jgi:hypothetical protein
MLSWTARRRLAMLLLLALLLGAVLGQRFKVEILIPAIALAITVGALSAHVGALWQIAVAAFSTGVSLQVGYLVGIGIRYIMTLVRTRRIGLYLSPGISSKNG